MLGTTDTSGNENEPPAHGCGTPAPDRGHWRRQRDHRLASVVADREPPELEAHGCGHRFAVTDAVRAEVLPASLPVVHRGIRAETRIRHHDADGDGRLDVGEFVDLCAPRLIPLDGQRVEWSEDDTLAVHQKVLRQFC